MAAAGENIYKINVGCRLVISADRRYKMSVVSLLSLSTLINDQSKGLPGGGGGGKASTQHKKDDAAVELRKEVE